MALGWNGGPLSLAGSGHGERRCRGGVEEGAGGDLCHGAKAEIERVTLAPLWHTSRGRRRGMREIERKVGSEREKRIKHRAPWLDAIERRTRETGGGRERGDAVGRG